MKIKLIGERNKKLTPTEQVLVNRGIPVEEIKHYLNTTDNDIGDYKGLENIELGVNTLIKHLKSQSNILIQVDGDVDGFTSAALLYNFIKSHFSKANLHYQVHDVEKHGLEMNSDVLNNKYDLIIVPDAGSNEYDKHKKLKELNIDCIVLDHHECEQESKDVIVINNQLSENYKNKALSGVGIVWQFCRAVAETLKKPMDEGYLDLVALGLVADVMDLREFETRRLVDKGIAVMNSKTAIKGQNTFLKAFIQKQSFSLGDTVTPIGLAFYIAPFINAIVRVGTIAEKELVFECFLEDAVKRVIPSTKRGAKKGDMETLGEQGLRVATNVKNRQKREEDKVAEKFIPMITDEYLKENSIIVIETDGTVNRNLNGLIANQFQSRFKRPTLVLSRKDGVVAGSGRVYESNVMSDFRGFIRESGLANYAEGHAQAFGTEFTEENFDKFIEYANKELDYSDCHKEYDVDFILTEKELTADFITELASLKHLWGKGVEEPLIAVVDAEITGDKKVMYNNATVTIKLFVNEVECLKFRSSEVEYDLLAPNAYTSSLIDLVGKPNLNYFNGSVTPQIFITEYQITGDKLRF